MTTRTKLWIGFGTLMLVIALSAVATVLRLRSIEREVGEMAAARNLSAAVQELEISMLGHALNVRAYLQNGDPELRGYAEQDAGEVDEQLREYERLAATERQREMAARFSAVWIEFRNLNRSLLSAENRQASQADLATFLSLRMQLQNVLDNEMRADAVGAYEAHSDEALREIRDVLAFAIVLLFAGTAIGVVTSWFVSREIIRSEAEVWDGKERLRVTLASIGDAVITTDTDGRIGYLNAVAEKLTGWTNADANGQPLESVFHIVNESTRDIVENPAARALREGTVVGLANHTVLIAKNKAESPIDDSAAPIRDEKGNVVGVVLIFRDVTERKEAEELNRRGEENVRLAFDAAELGSWHMDPETMELTTDERFRAIFGITPEQADYEQAVGHIHPDDQKRVRDAVTAATRIDAPEPYAIEYRVVHPDDSIHWVFAKGRSNIGKNGTEPRLLSFDGTVADITDHKQVEDSLRQSEQRFRMLADHMSQFAWTADAAGWINWYNQRWFDYTGTTLEDMQGWGWKKVHHPDHVDRVVARVQHSWDTGEVWEDTFPLRSKDGEYRWFLSRALPIRDDEGNVVQWFGTNTDVTEERQMADELRQLAANLSEADHRKNEFLAMLAHELRNPLAPISNALQIIRMNGDGSATAASEMMERQVGQLVRLVDDLLDVSRITQGKIELRTGRIELASFVNHAVEAARPSCENTGIELRVTIPATPIYLTGDPARLTQVVGNLLNNSCKFTDKGGRIDLIVETDNDHAVIRVRDTGIGIAPGQIGHIFELFVQADTSLERSISGLGIGLTLVKNLVEMHGGTIKADSPGLGHGSEFVVRLPILTATQKSSVPEPEINGKAAITQRRILVVDDNLDSAESLAMLLKLSGHEVQMAHDGLEAIKAAAEFLPEVILLDIGLPKLNGYEAAREIRQQKWGESITLIALTGWGQDEDRQRSKDAGFNSHMVKPVDHVELMKRLDELTDAETAPG
ncbi:MAG: PAS domain S-box protein [Saprospiraceae bacterium]|nr:PAS domain S-box protein [Pyrinomonadaceae bacterium]